MGAFKKIGSKTLKDIAVESEKLQEEKGISLRGIADRFGISYRSLCNARYTYLKKEIDPEIPKNLIEAVADEINGDIKSDPDKKQLNIVAYLDGNTGNVLVARIDQPDKQMSVESFEFEIKKQFMERLTIKYDTRID